MRLNKYLALSGVASRRMADNLIKAATTTVNNIVITDPAFQIKQDDIIRYDGKIIKINQDHVVIMFNKPLGVITSMSDPKNRPVIADYIPNKMRLFPVGRLDKNTSGLLLITNNGDLANKLMHPKNLIPKIYEIETDSILDAKLISKIKNGVFIGYKQWAKAIVIKQKKIKSRILVTLQLHHGKNREIRRMFNKINKKLFSLKRIKYGDLELGNLPLGKYRELNKVELNKVQKSINK
ncbi:MAG: pseudouridine synthase [Candidatus Neomarinimicrobiota bacterium]|nr:pseudouridine synthase [Candidatus Neomarinimicrobiota bacterium]MEC9027049.1 pseudouridine synthase [Candidatus Neomarinimicrobiota bacterium]|tara:strand:+ start:517 stop:1227 length:711 start_codon:yes stop_codon:yes gene_type:complete